MLFSQLKFILHHNNIFDIESLPIYKKLPQENSIYILYDIIYSPIYVHFTFILI